MERAISGTTIGPAHTSVSTERHGLWRSSGGRRVVASVVLGALAGASRVVPVTIVFEILRVSRPFDEMLALAVGATVAAVATGVLETSAMTAGFSGAGLIEARLRTRLLEHLDRVGLGWFLGRRAGVVRQAVLDDTFWPSMIYSEVYVGLARTIALAVTSGVFLLWVSPPLTVVMLLVGLLWLLPKRSRTAVGAAHSEHQKAADNLNAGVTEFTQGLPVFRVFASQGEEGGSTTRLEKVVVAQAAASEWLEAAESARRRWTDLGRDDLLVVALMLTVGLGVVSAGWAEPVAVVPFLLLGGTAGDAIGQLVGSGGARDRNQMVLENTEEVLRQPQLEVLSTATAPSIAPPPGVEFEAVSFSYTRGHPVLHDVSLRVERGTSVALVGASGAGKTTLARLLPRFWDSDSGVVRVLGDDVRTLDPAELYRRVAFVFQDVQLLPRSVRDNLLLARADASDADLDKVLQLVRLRERVLALPRGYDSVVGEDAAFSGGEAQRLSIARALLADPEVLVLDEPSAHADSATDRAVSEAIAEEAASRTLLMITHRLASAARFDRIIVFDRGRIAEDGTHSELLARDGLYARLWRAQRIELATTGIGNALTGSSGQKATGC